MSCHSEIRSRVQAKSGFHGRVVKPENGSKQECVRCHSDHYGHEFNIVKWDTTAEEFQHQQTGYPLLGRHAGLKCVQCHTPSRMTAAAKQGIQVKNLSRSYLGLTTQCSGCHADEHRGQLGGDCEKCHKSFQSWKPASGFDHITARFALAGKHAAVACNQCHKPMEPVNGKTTARFRDLPFASCTDCHKDPHHGAFPGACQSCHDAEGWKRIRLSSSSFDHSKTRFPLLGKHSELQNQCFKCHRNTNFKEPVAHERCADCHREDPHDRQFKTQDCAACHTDAGFKPSTFDVTRHQKSAYPLAGKHAAVACAKCHIPVAGGRTLYRVAYAKCLDCHKDAHARQFEGAPHKNRCENCHNESGFHPSTFTLSKHQKTRFQLTGAHVATACQECHKPPAGVHPPPPARFVFENSGNCTACHADPHRGQFAGVAVAARNGPAKSNLPCEGCHSTRSWKDSRAFDHALTGFALTGAHRSVGCTECHKPANMSTSIRHVVFEGAPKQCSGCHEDIHGGQFRTAGAPADCASCHREVAWKPVQFDHEKRTRFSLAGAHVEVPCLDCHRQKEEIAGRPTVIYAKASRECASCHRAK
jgi:hypothetical protein